MKIIISGIVALRHGSDGLTLYTTWVSGQKGVEPTVIIPHALKRYAERVGVDKTGVELVKHFFTNNGHNKDSHDHQAVGRSVRYNGEAHLSSCVNEGVLLGQQCGKVFVVKTFITYEMCCGRQQKEFDRCRRLIKTDKERYEVAKHSLSQLDILQL